MKKNKTLHFLFFSFNKKKAVSEIVAYVILIVIALSLSVIVYAWLKVYVPSQIPKCPDGTSLIIKNYTCNVDGAGTVRINFINKGLYDIDGAYIKFSNLYSGNLVYQPLPIGEGSKVDNQEGFFDFGISPLKSGQTREQAFDYLDTGINEIKRIQIEPFVTDDITHKPIICDKSIIVQEMVC